MPPPFVLALALAAGLAPAPDSSSARMPGMALDHEALVRMPSVSLARALATLPGARAWSDGAIGRPVLRALGGPRLRVTENGFRLEDNAWLDDDAPAVDVRQVDRVEVIRGPAVVLDGPGVLASVVRVGSAPLPSAGDPPVRGALEAYGATNDRGIGSALRAEGAEGEWGWRAMAIGRSARDVSTPSRDLDNSRFDALNGEAALGLRGTLGSAALRVARWGGSFRVPEPGGASTLVHPVHDLDDVRAQLDADYPIGGITLEARSQWQRHTLTERWSDVGEVFDVALDSYGLDLLAHHGAGGLRGVAGVSGFTQTSTAGGPSAVVPDARASSGGVLGLETLSLGRWSVTAGMRADFHHREVTPSVALGLRAQGRSDMQGSGGVGATYRGPGALSMTANATRGWRPPTLTEAYANGVRPRDDRFEIGDPALAPERSVNLDLGVRWSSRRARVEVTAFHQRIADFIRWVPTGEFRGVFRVWRDAQSDAALAGVEGGGEFDATHVLTLHARLDHVRGAFVGTHEPLPLVPPARVVAGAEMHAASLGWVSEARAGVEVEYDARQRRLSPDDVPTDRYVLLDLDAGAVRWISGRTVRLDLRVRNATNASYRDFLSRTNPFALDPGRNVIVSVGTSL